MDTMNNRYVPITEEKIKELDNSVKENQVVISKVGDGEYFCNVLGNVYSSYSKALEKGKEKIKNMVIVKLVGSDTYYLAGDNVIKDAIEHEYHSYYIESELSTYTIDDEFQRSL